MWTGSATPADAESSIPHHAGTPYAGTPASQIGLQRLCLLPHLSLRSGLTERSRATPARNPAGQGITSHSAEEESARQENVVKDRPDARAGLSRSK